MSSLLAPIGCQSYHAVPLTTEAVNRQLRPPTRELLSKQAADLRNPMLPPISIDPASGLSPEEAAVLAVLVNPSLRAQRDRRHIAEAQVLQAGILPNPTLSASLDFLTDGSRSGQQTAYSVGLGWDIKQLLTRPALGAAARASAQSIDLDVAWQEWQVAQAARSAAYDVCALREQQQGAQEIADRLEQIATKLKRALARSEVLGADAAAADASAQDARVVAATAQRDLRDAEIAFNRAVGLPPRTSVVLKPIELPSRLTVPDIDALTATLPDRRLDLIALRCGYNSQEAAVRAAIIAQFPAINLGLVKARDTSNVGTLGPAVTIDLPIFDRNQGNIAIETATRQQLFDEYVNRNFEARSDVAQAAATIESLNELIAVQAVEVPTLRKIVDAYDTALQRGNIDLGTYFTAANTLAQKQVDLIRSRQQLAKAGIALEIASGRYLLQATTMPTTQPAPEVRP